MFDLLAGISTTAGFLTLAELCSREEQKITTMRLTYAEIGWLAGIWVCRLLALTACIYWLWGNWIEIATISIGWLMLAAWASVQALGHPRPHSEVFWDYMLYPALLVGGVLLIATGIWNFIETPPVLLYILGTGFYILERLYKPPLLYFRY